jgi:cytochrome c oxidase assembly protein subunit 15
MYGAYTRLVDAGLGCPDWPGCYGFFAVPTDPQDIAIAESRFPHAPVETHKGWPEMIHRYLASTLGLLIFGLAALSWKQHEACRFPRVHTLVLSFMVVLQGLFGMWTVTLKLWPQVVSAHLLGGFTTFCLLAWLAMRLWHKPVLLPPVEWQAVRRTRMALAIGMLLLVGQISLGAWVSANYAAVACPDFPTCQEQLWPPMDFKEGFNLTQEIGPNYLGGALHYDARVAIHMSHRMGAVLVTIAIIAGLILVWRATRSAAIRRLAVLTGTLLALQIGLGITNVVALLPLSVAVAHNAVAVLLLASMLWLLYRIWTARHADAGGAQ